MIKFTYFLETDEGDEMDESVRTGPRFRNPGLTNDT